MGWRDGYQKTYEENQEGRAKFWKPTKVGETIEGDFVDCEEGEYRGKPTHTPILMVNGKNIKLSGHATLVNKLFEMKVDPRDRIKVTFKGQAEGKDYFLYDVEKL